MNFNFFSNQQLFFGPNKLELLPDIILFHGTSILLLTGSTSFLNSRHWEKLSQSLKASDINYHTDKIKREPTPDDIDSVVERYKEKKIDVVVAIGGGSVLDAGKAISAMLPKEEPVIQYLEGIGNKIHDGFKIPFIAIPTTSGTGSEATKNAVISDVGKSGYKKSLRHDNFIPNVALVDPVLTLTCPKNITAACGMDALTQLVESFVSTHSSPMTDALACSGLTGLGNALVHSTLEDPNDISTRSKLSYASYLSGLTLANAGLGLVHGFAGVIGGLFGVPHGIVCGTLLAETTQQNIEVLIEQGKNNPALLKYAKINRLLIKDSTHKDPVKESLILAEFLYKWTDLLNIPKLGSYGIKESDIDNIVAATGQKFNPVHHTQKKLARILKNRL